MPLFVKRGIEKISLDTRQLISKRYRAVTRAVNREFWNLDNDVLNSLYVGSYGRGTAISTSDIDILITLPQKEYERFDDLKGNGQSRLLQAVRNAILTTYPRSDIRADGQVVKIVFSDGIYFEILPSFKNFDGTFTYPDTNMGGNWKSTNPKAEQEAMSEKNRQSKGLFYDTCKHIRYVRDNYFKSYHLSGIVIDSFVYNAIGNWIWPEYSDFIFSKEGDFEKMLLGYYYSNVGKILLVPGSNMMIQLDDREECLEKVLRKMAY